MTAKRSQIPFVLLFVRNIAVSVHFMPVCVPAFPALCPVKSMWERKDAL